MAQNTNCPFNNEIQCDFKYRDAEFARQSEVAQNMPNGKIERVYYSCTCMVDYRQCPRFVRGAATQKQR